MQGATVVHMLPGRIRLRFASRRGDAAFFEGLVRDLSAHPLVDRVRANPLTGSLLLEHSAGPAELASFAEHSGLPVALEAPSPGPAAPSRARRRGRLRAMRLSGPAATLSALGLYQATRGRLLGSGGELFWHALRVSGTRYGWIAAALLASGLVQALRGRWLPPASSLIAYAILFDQTWGAAQFRRQSTARMPHEPSAIPLVPDV